MNPEVGAALITFGIFAMVALALPVWVQWNKRKNKK